MYAALWRALPGGRLAKSAQCLVLFLLVVAVLFVWVFPAVATRLPFENVTVQPGAVASETPGGFGSGLGSASAEGSVGR